MHTNGLENFWSLLKRGLKGTYISTEPFHLFRYLDEQAWRYNNRGSNDNPVHDGERSGSLIAGRGEAVDLRGGHWQGAANGSLIPVVCCAARSVPRKAFLHVLMGDG